MYLIIRADRSLLSLPSLLGNEKAAASCERQERAAFVPNEEETT